MGVNKRKLVRILKSVIELATLNKQSAAVACGRPIIFCEMKPTAFENAIFEWVVAHTEDSAIQRQLAEVDIVEREPTGVGCYSKISTPNNAPPAIQPVSALGPLSGPIFQSPAVEHGGMTLIWFSDGVADTLEIVTFTDHFPDNHDAVALAGFTLHTAG